MGLLSISIEMLITALLAKQWKLTRPPRLFRELVWLLWLRVVTCTDVTTFCLQNIQYNSCNIFNVGQFKWWSCQHLHLMGLFLRDTRDDHQKILLNFLFRSSSCFAIIMTSIEQKLDRWESRVSLTFFRTCLVFCHSPFFLKDVM